MRRWAHVRRCLSLGWLPSSCTGLLTSSSSSTVLCGNGSSLHVARAFLSNSRIQYKSLSQEVSADEPGNTSSNTSATTIETHNASNSAGDANKKDTTRTPVRPKETVAGTTHTRSEMSNAASAHLVSPAAMPEGSNTATNVIQPPSASLPLTNERTRRVGRRRLRAAGLAESTQEKPSTVSSTISEATVETSSAPRMTRGTRRRLARRAMGLTGNDEEVAAVATVESSNSKVHATSEHQTNEAEVHTVSTHNKNHSGEVERRGKVHQEEEENDGMPCIQHVAPVRVHEPVYYMDYHDGTEYLRAVNNNNNKKESEGDTSKRTRTTTATAAMRRPSEADLTAERASITKLFLIADSVDFLFTALPCDRDWVKRYLRRVDNAVLPTNALNAGLQASTLGRRRRHGDAITPATTSEERRIINESNDITSESQPSATSYTASKDTNVFGDEEGRAVEQQQPQGGVEELLQRMVLQRPTSNTIWIHVRDYEQQVPPPQLMLRASATMSANTSQSDSSPNSTSSNSNSSNEVVSSTEGKASEGSESEARSRRRRRGRKAKAVTIAAAATSQPQEQSSPPLNDEATSTANALSPLDAVLALQAWRQEAQERARQSVARHQKDYQHHTITRVRFHDPAKRDVTVVIGAGSSSTIHEVLADMDGKAQSILRDRPHMSSRRSGNSFTSNNNKEDDEMNFDDEDDDEREGNGRGPFARPGRSSDASRVSDDKDDDAHRREIKKLHKSLKEIVVIDTPETPEEEGLFRLTHPEHAAMASLPKWDRHSFMKLPFLLTPLLTVFATCVPRRAGDFSQIYSEHDFLASGGGRRGGEKKANSQANYASSDGATTMRSVKCHAEGENSTKVTHNFPLATMSDAQVAEAVRRCGVPPGPRFFTRITVIVEHAELSPTDLVSLAEGSTPRKAKATQQQEGGSSSNNSETRVTVSPRVRGRPRRIYCLVSNGSL